MAIAITMVPFKYVLRCDRALNKDMQTSFLLRRLSAEENAQIEDAIRYSSTASSVAGNDPEVTVVQSPGSTVLEILRVGLKGWENFLDEDHNPIAFTAPSGMDSTCPMSNIDKIHPDHRHELARAIEEGNTISEEDSKN